MTQPSFAQLANPNSAANGLTQQDIISRMVTELAILCSGSNPDGTAFSLNVGQNLGTTGGNAIASAAYTTTQTSPDIVNDGGRGLVVILNTSVIGTGSITLYVNGKSPVSTTTAGNGGSTATGTPAGYYPLVFGTAVVTNTTLIYRVAPGLTPSTNAVANDVVPNKFNIIVVANNANSATYSVDYILGV